MDTFLENLYKNIAKVQIERDQFLQELDRMVSEAVDEKAEDNLEQETSC